MDYSMCLMALVASRVEELKAEFGESLQPHLQRITELVTSFFGRPAVADCGLGVRTGTGSQGPRDRTGGGRVRL